MDIYKPKRVLRKNQPCPLTPYFQTYNLQDYKKIILFKPSGVWYVITAALAN